MIHRAEASRRQVYEWVANRFFGAAIAVGYSHTVVGLIMDGLGSPLAGVAPLGWASAGFAAAAP